VNVGVPMPGVQDLLPNVIAKIDEDELIELALALGNLDSPTGEEGAASDKA
jgi:hypothetical protein